MKTAKQLCKALCNLDYKALHDFSEQELVSIIENDGDEMDLTHSILIGIISLRHNTKGIEETDIEKVYKCIKILTQKYPDFLELKDITGTNTLSILYSSQDITAKEVVLKLLLDDPEVNIPTELLLVKNNQADATLPQYSLAELISKDADFVIPKINSLEIFERFKALDILPVNSKDSNGKTILHHEFALSSLNAFKALVEMGAELLPDNKGKTPYYIAKKSNKQEIVKFIKERVSKNFANGVLTKENVIFVSPHFMEQEITSQEALEIIAVHGLNVFLKAQKLNPTRSLLHMISFEDSMSVGLLGLLVARRADVNVQDQYGDTPLHYAALYCNTEVAELLIKHGAAVNTQNRNGLTPLHYTASYCKTEVAVLLVKRGADVNARNNYRETPLHYAARNGHSVFVKLLIDKGADVNVQDQYGDTPLHCAAMRGHSEVVKLLIEKGNYENLFDKSAAILLNIIGYKVKTNYDLDKKRVVYNTTYTPKIMLGIPVLTVILGCITATFQSQERE